MVFAVPDQHSGLLRKRGFRPTKKNPAHWWRLFDPNQRGSRDFAARLLAELKTAGLASKWSEVEHTRQRWVPNAQVLNPRIAGPASDPRDRRRQLDMIDARGRAQ